MPVLDVMLGSIATVRRLDARILSDRSLSAMALAGALLAATGAGAEVFRKEDLLRGITITHAQCDATPQTLWLGLHGREFCVRYYLSTAGGEGLRPVVFLQGDQLGKFNTKTWSWMDTSLAKDVDTDDIMKIADGFSKEAKTTAVYLARIGVDGTSGNHMSRKTLLELELMNAALDAIKQRYGFEGFHLAGQSGGSKIVAGLIGLRRDVACAVIGSGPLVAPDGRKSADPGRTAFDATENIAQVVQNRALRPILVTDKADKTVPIDQQTGYVDRLRKAGRQVPELFVEALETTDDKHHGVTVYTELVTAGCVLGRSDDEIARAVSTLVKRNVEYNERRRKEAGAKASILAAARQPAPDASVAAAGKK
jgi:pimeloyl-ACP methyl ester carboxylesterase